MPFGSAVLDKPWQTEGRELALSLASLICAPGAVAGHRDVSRMLATLRRRAKSMSGTSWVFGRPGSGRIDVVRGPMDMVGTQQPVPDQPLRGVGRIPTQLRTE